MLKFKCNKCGKIFENEGENFEYHSPVYGPCSKRVADCPDCGIRSDEFRKPKQTKSKSAAGIPPVRGCAAGGCCCTG